MLDADLASDCRVRSFELTYPERFLECGIAEQDMVSAAAGIARHGLLPVVNSFASFLASRANEQIYNQASEKTKVVYALHYAGLSPPGPGKSHQSVRDVSLLAALPNMTIVQPANAEETARAPALGGRGRRGERRDAARDRAVSASHRASCRPAAQPGRGRVLREGDDAVLFAYGPVMLHEALLASESLERDGVGVAVVDMPWLNRLDAAWLEDVVGPRSRSSCSRTTRPSARSGTRVRRELDGRPVTVFGVEGWPACGTPQEALRFHGLDGASLAERIDVAGSRATDLTSASGSSFPTRSQRACSSTAGSSRVSRSGCRSRRRGDPRAAS